MSEHDEVRCAECGMRLWSWAEWHSYAICLYYKRTRSSMGARILAANLKARESSHA